jgi:hypothetical protein
MEINYSEDRGKNFPGKFLLKAKLRKVFGAGIIKAIKNE